MIINILTPLTQVPVYLSYFNEIWTF